MRKALNGDLLVFDHADIDIVLMVEMVLSKEKYTNQKKETQSNLLFINCQNGYNQKLLLLK
jgi:uncharacterized protein YfaT (DUF1175 family)